MRGAARRARPPAPFAGLAVALLAQPVAQRLL
jgi:hypothetical protein